VAYTWMKLYVEVLDDPKVAQLPDHLWRRTFEVMLAAKEFDDAGRLPDLGDLAYRLRTTEEELEGDLIEIEAWTRRPGREPVIVKQGDDRWLVTHLEKRQAPTPGTERVRQHRERYESGKGNVTNRYADRSEKLPDSRQQTQTTDETADTDRDQTADTEADAPESPEALVPAAAALPGPAFALLQAFGIGEPALSKHAGLPPPMVEAWIEAIKLRTGIQNPSGLLVSCLEAGGWPPRVRASPDSDDDHERAKRLRIAAADRLGIEY